MQDILSFINKNICPICGDQADIVDWTEEKNLKNPFLWIISCKNCNPKNSDHFFLSQDAVYKTIELDENQRKMLSCNVKESKLEKTVLTSMNFDRFLRENNWLI